MVLGGEISISSAIFSSIRLVTCTEETLIRELIKLQSEDAWVTVVWTGDIWTADYWDKIGAFIKTYPKLQMVFTKKTYLQSKKNVPFSVSMEGKREIVSERNVVWLHSFFLQGMVIRAEQLAGLSEFLQFGEFAETVFLLERQQEWAHRQMLGYLSDIEYSLACAREGDKIFFGKLYEKKWYERLIHSFALPFFLNKKDISLLWQYHMAFLIDFCVEANLNNMSKRLFSEQEAEQLLWQFGEVLYYIEDFVLLDSEKFVIEGKNSYLRRWFYLILKYKDTHLEYDFFAENGRYYYGFRAQKAGLWSDLTVDIQAMRYEKNCLSIDGRVSPFVYMNGSHFYVQAGKQKILVQRKERYAHTKAFGVSIYKLQAFHVEIPLQSATRTSFSFFCRGDWGRAAVTLEFNSHFSRLTNRFAHSYWKMDTNTMLTAGRTKLVVRPMNFLGTGMREFQLWIDMLKTKDKMVIKYIPVRLFMLSRPLWKKRPIWLFIDKIYKGGDSSEYLYHYVKETDSRVRSYYLLDESSPDYKRFQQMGDKPLKRRSLAHRLVFLSADWIIISNSTVFAFNDFSTKNSAYIRDLIHFHVACVQHGMSVQKIAVAQNRLRDNIELYFCASCYEIENLMKPVYDYADYSILKLTGVPRYDGLVNRDKKQILISPTWRMQAAVPVSKNESVERDYNPLFRETTYYQVYNSLINDLRLLEAARRYGYRIIYVLHPIVSPQAGDFETNDFVEIIPATGEMSYEKIFCESSLMVTDFSGVQFDFAYMRKPLVYLHHRLIPQHYEEGTFHYDSMAFGEICHDNEELISLLCDYMAHGCVMKEKYRRRADDFFAYDDHKNCERIYQEMKKFNGEG